MRRKLNAMPAVFEGRSVLLVDDSIVRGTTMSQIVDMVRQAGATKVPAAPAAHLHEHADVRDMPCIQLYAAANEEEEELQCELEGSRLCTGPWVTRSLNFHSHPSGRV